MVFLTEHYVAGKKLFIVDLHIFTATIEVGIFSLLDFSLLRSIFKLRFKYCFRSSCMILNRNLPKKVITIILKNVLQFQFL